MNDKKHLRCAECGIDIEDWYYTIGDNFMQARFFEDEDGLDNVFCSESCICECLSVLSKEVED